MLRVRRGEHLYVLLCAHSSENLILLADRLDEWPCYALNNENAWPKTSVAIANSTVGNKWKG